MPSRLRAIITIALALTLGAAALGGASLGLNYAPSPGSYRPHLAYSPPAQAHLMAYTEVDLFRRVALKAKLLAPDGTPSEATIDISDPLAALDLDAEASVARLPGPEGRFLVLWADWRGNSNTAQPLSANPTVWAQVIDKHGTPQGGNYRVSSAKHPAHSTPSVACSLLASEGCLVLWHTRMTETGESYAIHGELLNENGSPEGLELEVSPSGPGRALNPSAAYDAKTHRFLAVWEDYNKIKGVAQSRIMGRLLMAETAEFISDTALVVAEPLEGTRLLPTAASDAEGAFFVAWHDFRGGLSAAEVYAQGMSAEGVALLTPATTNLRLSETPTATSEQPALAYDTRAGHFLTLWQELGKESYDVAAAFTTREGKALDAAYVSDSPSLHEVHPAVSYNPDLGNFLVAYEATDYASAFDIEITVLTDPTYPDLEAELEEADDTLEEGFDFGRLEPGSLGRKTLWITNEGPAAALRAGLTNSPSEPFEIANDTCTGRQIPPGGRCGITVSVGRAASGGLYTDSLLIESNDPDEPALTLPLRALVISSDITMGDTSGDTANGGDAGRVRTGDLGSWAMVVENTGATEIVLGSLSLTQDPEAPEMPFTLASDNCSGVRLTPGARCVVVVSFAPTSAGSYATTLEVPSDDLTEPLRLLSIKGLGVAPKAVAEPGEADFGVITSGGTSAPRTITIKNEGSAPLALGALSGPSEPFALAADNCSYRSVLAGGSCTLQVYFKPATKGSYTGSFALSSEEGQSTIVVALRGLAVDVAVADLEVSGVTTLAARTGEVAYASLDLSNIGQSELVLGALGTEGLQPPFYLLEDRCSGNSLAPGSSCTVTVSYAPLGEGSSGASLTITSNDPDAPAYSVALTGASSTINQPPSAPRPLLPAPGAVVEANEGVEFLWGASTDPEGDSVMYLVYISEREDFAGEVPALITPINPDVVLAPPSNTGTGGTGGSSTSAALGSGLGLALVGLALGHKRKDGLLAVALALGLSASVFALSSCGDMQEGGTLVTQDSFLNVAVILGGGERASQSPAATSLPSVINSVSITLTGPGMQPTTTTLYPTEAGLLLERLSAACTGEVYIEARGFDKAGRLRYSGSTAHRHAGGGCGSAIVRLYDTSTVSYTVHGLRPGVQYYWKVSAMDAKGATAEGAVTSFRTK